MLLGGFVIGDDFAILEESCYIWRPCFDALVLEVSLEDLSLVCYTWRFLWLRHLEAWEVFALVVLEIDDALLMMDED